METLMDRANKIAAEGIFLGGTLKRFEIAGRTQLIALLNEGLNPNSRVLDIGCGCLRGGYWLIHFLDKNRYFGIEPNKMMLEAGIKYLLEPGLVSLKEPRFDHNADFNFSIFRENFDYFVALSIWTHAAKRQIQSMLDGFVSTASPKGVLLTTYYPATVFKPDYKGQNWIGAGDPVQPKGMVNHSFGWIKEECTSRGLSVTELKGEISKYWNQTWLRIDRQAH